MSVEQLKDALKLTLEKRRLLSKIKAHLRAEVFKSFEETDHDKKPAIPRLQLLINELIRDYLEWSEYSYTLGVFLQESGQPEEKLERRLLSREFYLSESDQNQELLILKKRPMLFSLISTMRTISQNVNQNNNELPSDDKTLPETATSMHYEERFDNDYSDEGFVPHVLKL